MPFRRSMYVMCSLLCRQLKQGSNAFKTQYFSVINLMSTYRHFVIFLFPFFKHPSQIYFDIKSLIYAKLKAKIEHDFCKNILIKSLN